MDPSGYQPHGMAGLVGQHIAAPQQPPQPPPAPAYSFEQHPQPKPQPARTYVAQYKLKRQPPPGYIFTVNEVRLYQQFLQNIPQWDANTYLDQWQILGGNGYFSPGHQQAWADICASCCNLSRHFRVNAPPPTPTFSYHCQLPRQLPPGYIFQVVEVLAYQQFFLGIRQRDVDTYRDLWRILGENDYSSRGHQEAWADICDFCNFLSNHIRVNAPWPPRQPSVSSLVRLPVEIILMVVAECNKNRTPRANQANPSANHGRQLSGGVYELSQVNKFFNNVCAKYLFASACIETSGADLEEAVLDYTKTTSSKLAMDLVKTLSVRKSEKWRGSGQGSLNLPRSIFALAQLMPSLRELDLFLHRTAAPGLRKLLGSKTGTPMPTVKALRFITESPVSLAFLVVAFPRLQTLSLKLHDVGFTGMTGWNIGKYRKLRSMRSLVTVQMFKWCWRLADLREIQECFPNIERLLLMGRIPFLTLTMFGDALAGLSKLRELSWTVDSRSFVGVKNDFRTAAEQKTFGDCDLRWGGLGPVVVGKGDIERCMLAMDMFRHPGLAKLEVIGICERACPDACVCDSCEGLSGPVASRIYKPVKSPQGIVVGADAVRDYVHDGLREGGRSEFWFKGERAVMSRDREWLKDELLFSLSIRS